MLKTLLIGAIGFTVLSLPVVLIEYLRALGYVHQMFDVLMVGMALVIVFMFGSILREMFGSMTGQAPDYVAIQSDQYEFNFNEETK